MMIEEEIHETNFDILVDTSNKFDWFQKIWLQVTEIWLELDVYWSNI